jgi:hypothetical protein
LTSNVEVIDATGIEEYERFLYKCLSPIPFRKYRKRREYLEAAIAKGFRKEILFLNGKAVGQIEYSPAEVSGYPISCNERCIVMNCIWVLRKAKGNNFGKLLMNNMIKSERDAACFATIGLENHWSPWFKKWKMEKLGFKSIDSIEVMHKIKHRGERFKIHLMWLPIRENASQPTWNREEMLKGVDFCIAHPLYRAEKFGDAEILEKCK